MTTSAVPLPRARLLTGGVLPVLVLIVVLVVSMLIALGIGAVSIPVDSVIAVVARRLGMSNLSVENINDQIVWQLRMPRVLGAAATGAGLAIAGAVLQSLTRNDLADPYLLGISGGAAVGAVTVIVLGVSVAGLIGATMVTVGAFAGAIVAIVLVLAVATGRAGNLQPTRTILAGVAIAELCAAYTAFIVIMSGDQDAARRVLSWTLGSLAGLRWETALFLVLVALVAIATIMAFSSSLDAFAFGDASAGSLGIRVNQLRWILLIGTALLTACLVAFTGAIGFVGLVVPHVVRLIFGPLHRYLLPLSAFGGAILLVWADTIARSLLPGREIPIGVVTAVIGVPVFAWLLRRDARRA